MARARPAGEEPSQRRVPRLVAAGIVAAAVLVFVLQNTGTSSVSFLFWRIEGPAWTWLLLVFALGAAVGWAFSSRRRR